MTIFLIKETKIMALYNIMSRMLVEFFILNKACRKFRCVEFYSFRPLIIIFILLTWIKLI